METAILSSELQDLKSVTDSLINELLSELRFQEDRLTLSEACLKSHLSTLESKKSYFSFIRSSIFRSDQRLHLELESLEKELRLSEDYLEKLELILISSSTKQVPPKDRVILFQKRILN
jgi:hypothetical protein